jgi:hypothetical protein
MIRSPNQREVSGVLPAFRLAALRPLAPSAPNQDDAAGDESQSTIDQAVDTVQAVPLEDMPYTQSQIEKPDDGRNQAESGAE